MVRGNMKSSPKINPLSPKSESSTQNPPEYVLLLVILYSVKVN